MAGADLDVIIRRIAKAQNKSLVAATKAGRAHYLKLAMKAKDKDTKARYKQLANDAMLHGSAAAKRLQVSADNAADSYARSMRKAVDDAAAKPAAAPAKPAKSAKPAKREKPTKAVKPVKKRKSKA